MLKLSTFYFHCYINAIAGIMDESHVPMLKNCYQINMKVHF